MAVSKERHLSDDRLPTLEDQIRRRQYALFIEKRKAEGLPARIFTPELENAREIASLIAAGGLVIIPWGKEKKKIYCLVGCYDDFQATKLMNEVKGRAANQTLAVGCLPQSICFLTQIEKSRPLINAACGMFKKNPSEVKREDLENVLDFCYDRPVGLVLEAKDNIPEIVANKTFRGRTILITGENDYTNPQDIYNYTLWELSTRYGKVIAGTSANPSTKQVYSIFDQEQAYYELGYKVDGFVKFDRIPKKPRHGLFLTSSTIIDLTEDNPVVKRWGSLHPLRFKNIFPDLVIPKDVVKNQDAETTFDTLHIPSL